LKHLSYRISNSVELENILSSNDINALLNRNSILVQVYCASTDTEWIEKIKSIISNKMPHAIIIGATTVGEITYGKTHVNSTVIGFSFFESSSMEIIFKDCDTGKEFSTGKSIVQEIEKINENVSGILLLSTPLSLDVKTLLNGFETSSLNYSLFGGGAGDYASMENSLVFTDDWISARGAIVVVFKGNNLYIESHTYLGWRPLSKEMTITEADGMLVKTIDNKPAFDIYKHYLGFQKDENFFQNVLEFPLIMTRDDEDIARVPVFVNEDGGIQFVADIHEGEKFKIGYGDPELIIADAEQMHELVSDSEPEAVFLYTCGCRRFLMQDDVELETLPFEELAPTFGFYTYGEFFGTLANAQLLNSTMVVVSMREGKVEKKNTLPNNAPTKKEEVESDPYANKHRRIISRLVHFVQAVTDEISKKNLELEQLSITDNLTKLYNRNKLDDVLISEVNRSNRYSSPFGIVLIDIDYFKSVNDIYGHQVGDTVLKEFSQILRSNSRNTDVVGRWGGEEFLIICSQSNLENILTLANYLKEKISTYPFSLGEQKTASFGVAIYNKDENIDEMIKRADDALYKAKENGRNRVEYL
jgi:diguanylate cyclase (GGDEF)-like protein